MSERNPYALLGVSPDAEDAEIRRAYRRLARAYHPDHNPGDAQAASRFADIAWAYAQVNTPAARAQLHEHVTRLSDEIRAPFVPTSRLPEQGDDRLLALSVTFAEAYAGVSQRVEWDAYELCDVCGGSGAASGSVSHQCVVCRGVGGHQAGGLHTPCGACEGRGVIIDRVCGDCDDGRRAVRRAAVIEIPAGVEDGAEIVLPQHGDPGTRAHGSLVVRVSVEPSAVFERLADGDLLVEVAVSYAEACLGASLRVPAPDRLIVVDLPPGTPSGALLRARACGMPRPPGPAGDLYIRPRVSVPERLGSAERRLLTELRAHDNPSLRQDLLSRWSQERESPRPDDIDRHNHR